MPELPEVETLKRYLQDKLVGKTILKVDVIDAKLFHGNCDDILGKEIKSVERLGKVLAIKLQNNTFLSFHFKLSGQLLYSSDASNAIFKNVIPLSTTNKMPGKSTRVIFYFNDNSGLFFNEMRKFGWVKCSEKIEGPKGVDILDKNFTINYFEDNLKKTRRPIKIVLMDQDKYAGIGNIYANEALYLSKINPATQAGKLDEDQIRKLYSSIKFVINKGIRFKGSSGRDEVYVLPDGSKGEYQNHFLVYQQENNNCKRCQNKIKRIKQNGRSSFFCPFCQAIKNNAESLF